VQEPPHRPGLPPQGGVGHREADPARRPRVRGAHLQAARVQPRRQVSPATTRKPSPHNATVFGRLPMRQRERSKQRTLEPIFSFVAFAFLTETFFPNSNGSCNTFIALDSFSSKGGFSIREVCSLPDVHGRLGLPQPRRLVTLFIGDSAVLPPRAASCNGPLLFGLVRPETCVF
jgi:hypothetical protein